MCEYGFYELLSEFKLTLIQHRDRPSSHGSVSASNELPESGRDSHRVAL
jgi:hypothetical protein